MGAVLEGGISCLGITRLRKGSTLLWACRRSRWCFGSTQAWLSLSQ
jgi:hypothetical protein